MPCFLHLKQYIPRKWFLNWCSREDETDTFYGTSSEFWENGFQAIVCVMIFFSVKYNLLFLLLYFYGKRLFTVSKICWFQPFIVKSCVLKPSHFRRHVGITSEAIFSELTASNLKDEENMERKSHEHLNNVLLDCLLYLRF